ncbi:hypothetical protein SM033_00246 [Vibrio phage vB_VpaM_sm033]|nr:hypothetical protein SM033_00246 [Vibrio phage vB_VpaM_sm033]
MNPELEALLVSPEINAVLSEDFKEEANYITGEEAMIDMCLMEIEKLEAKEKEIDSVLAFVETADAEDVVSQARIENLLSQMFPETEDEANMKVSDRVQNAGMKAKKRVQAAVQQILLAIKKFVRNMLNNDKGTVKKGKKVIAELKKMPRMITVPNMFKGRAGFWIEDAGFMYWRKPPASHIAHLKFINGIDWPRFIDAAVTIYTEGISNADQLHRLVGTIAPVKGGENAFARVSTTKGSLYNAAVLFKAGKIPADVEASYKWTGSLANRVGQAGFKGDEKGGYDRDAIITIAEEAIASFDKIAELNKILDDKTLFDQVDKDGAVYKKQFARFMTSTIKSYVKYYRTVGTAGIALAANAAKGKEWGASVSEGGKK